MSDRHEHTKQLWIFFPIAPLFTFAFLLFTFFETASCKYILNQKEHHKKRTSEQEYRKMLADFGIEIGKKQLFEFFLPD